MSERLEIHILGRDLEPNRTLKRTVKEHGPYMDRNADVWPQGTKVTWFRETGTHQYTLRAGPRWDLDRVTYTGLKRKDKT
jgi:hypothetical protein